MKLFGKKILTLTLAVGLLFTSLPIQNVKAQETTTQEVESQVQTEPQTEKEQNEGIEALKLQYLVIEQPEIKTPDVQNIVMDFGDDSFELDRASLKYQDMGSGEEYEIEASAISDTSIRFTISYQNSNVQARFKLISVELGCGDASKIITMDEAGIEAKYGVNCDVNNLPSGYLVEENKNESGITVQTIDEDGTVASSNSIEEAINEVETNEISTFAMEQRNTGNVVVVLDPGHGGNDPGTSAIVNGTTLVERDINLKIAQYCKQELETYAGVTVYMTRSDNTSTCLDRQQRAQFAAERGANVLVSIHINEVGKAGTYTNTNGAEVWCPHSGYRPDISQQGTGLGNRILSQLEALGLTNRGVQYKNATDGSTYPDGSIQDYYGINNWCKEYGLPGIIVEHAFINNVSDATNFLSTDEQLKRLGIADATGIADNYGLQKGKNVALYGIYYEEHSQDISAALSYATDDEGIQFRWMEYSVDKGQWKVLSDWSNKSSISWKPGVGNYWLSVDTLTSDGIQQNYTLVYQSERDYVNKYVTLNGIYAVERTNGIDAAVSYASNDENVEFRWMSYDIAKNEWRILSNWSKKEAITWKPGNGNYWLSVDARTSSGTQKNYTLTYQSKKDYSALNMYGIYAIGGKESISAALSYSSYDENTKFRWMVYDISKGEWRILSNWSNASSITWNPEAGNYWLSVDALTSDGIQKNCTITYQNSKDYTGLSMYGIYTISGSDSIAAALSYSSKDTNTKFRWMSYDMKKGQWRIIEDWGSKTSISWKPESGDFWLSVDAVTSSGAKKNFTLTLTNNRDYTHPYIELNGIYCADSADGISCGAVHVTNDPNAEYRWLVYDMDKGTWTIISNWSKSEWTTWLPDAGNYWLRSEARTSDGKEYNYTITYIAEKYAIMGTSNTTVNQMVAYYNANQAYPTFYANTDAPTIQAFCQLYWEECVSEGVKPEVAFCQAMKETGFLRFKADVKITQFNFAGIGATGGGEPGNTFSNVREGIRAQVQHLKAYASKEALKNACVDPRYAYVTKGCAAYVEWLGQKENPSGKGWAVDENYGYSIKKDYIQKLLYTN